MMLFGYLLLIIKATFIFNLEINVLLLDVFKFIISKQGGIEGLDTFFFHLNFNILVLKVFRIYRLSKPK